MDNKFFVSVLLIFTVLIVCIGGVSAADNISDNQSAYDVDSGSVVSNPQVVGSDGNVVYQENSVFNDSQILGDSNDGIIINSSEDLDNVLDNDSINNTIIYLNNQSLSFNGTLHYFEHRNLTLCGGKSLNDNLTSSICDDFNFDSTYSNITFIRVNFVNLVKNLMIYGSNAIFNECNFQNSKMYIIYSYDSDITFINSNWSDTDNNNLYSYLSFHHSNLKFINNSFKDLNVNKLMDIHSSNCSIDNCNFDNLYYNKSTIYMDGDSTALNVNGYSNISINNSKFSKSPHAIEIVDREDNINITINNSTFSNHNSSAIYVRFSDNDINFKIYNSNFTNNTGKSGAAIHAMVGDYLIDNCSFVNNSASYGGAIYSPNILLYTEDGFKTIDSNVTIDNSSFVNNYATYAGGALSCDNVDVNNSKFENNKAGLFGGAIIVGNSTKNNITNNVFSNNDANSYGDDIFYYYGNLTLENNSELDLYNDSNHTTIFNDIVYMEGQHCYIVDNHTGFCLEQNFFSSSNIRAYFNNTYIIINSINHKYVGNYIKYLIFNYYGKISNELLQDLIWTFTNRDYEDPAYFNNHSACNIKFIELDEKDSSRTHAGITRGIDNAWIYGGVQDSDIDTYFSIFEETYTAVNNGVIIPDSGATKLNDDGTVSVYNFSSLLAPESQNIVFFEENNISDVNPSISIIKITNNPVVYKGNDTSFDIVVTNNGTVMLSNVTVTEDSYDDLTYKSWSSINGNWTYDYVDGKHTWTLTGYLGVNQTASFNVVFSTGNSTLGNKTNTVSVTTNENVTGNASNVTEVIENNTSNNNTPNTTENNTPNKPTPVNNKTVENNNTEKADIKTTESTGYPFIPLIIALIGIVGARTRKK